MSEKKSTLDYLKNAISILKGEFQKENEVKLISSKVLYKFEIVEDSEGKTISYPSLEEGAPVTQASSEGDAPANDGWYAVEGGVEIRVESGLIAEIKAPEAPAEESEQFEEEPKEEAPADNTAVVTAIEQAVEAVTAIQEEIENLKTEFSKFSKMDDNVKALTDAVQKFSKEPVAVTVTQPVEATEPVSKMDKIRAIGQRNLKK